MSDPKTIAYQHQLLEDYRENLRVLLRQVVSYGGEMNAPLAMLNSIRQTRKEIARIKTFLRSHGLDVYDDPIEIEREDLLDRTALLAGDKLNSRNNGFRYLKFGFGRKIFVFLASFMIIAVFVFEIASFLSVVFATIRDGNDKSGGDSNRTFPAQQVTVPTNSTTVLSSYPTTTLKPSYEPLKTPTTEPSPTATPTFTPSTEPSPISTSRSSPAPTSALVHKVPNTPTLRPNTPAPRPIPTPEPSSPTPKPSEPQPSSDSGESLLPPSQKAVVRPQRGPRGTIFAMISSSFTPGEQIGVYVTAPDKSVYGASFQVSADDQGLSEPVTFRSEADTSFPTGIWAVTFEGIDSGNKAIAYFEVTP